MRPPRLDRIFQNYDPPLYFVTFNTYRRARILACHAVHERFITFAQKAEVRGIAVGRYVIMPDHVHLFVQGRDGFVLPDWMRMLKMGLAKGVPTDSPHWQEGFFDHLIRHKESHAQKWDYVRENPVRAGLVASADQWEFQGEIVCIS